MQEHRQQRAAVPPRDFLEFFKLRQVVRLGVTEGGDHKRNAVLSGGVASSYQARDPWPLYLERGNGPKVWDVDGNELWDFHNGFGSMVQGHAHPAIGEAIRERYGSGTHFAAPTEDAIVVGEELARRFRLPKWRYTNSGSESTMAFASPTNRLKSVDLPAFTGP